MKKTACSVILTVIALTTTASSMSDANYQKSRASERVINALQLLQENKGYSESQQIQLTTIQGSLFSLAVELLTEIETSGASLEDHEKARSLQRALSIVHLTADISGFTPEQVIIIGQIRNQAFSDVNEIRSQIVLEKKNEEVAEWHTH